MINLFIKRYVSKITKDDIISYGKQNNIILTNNDVDTIYSYIKNNYHIIINDKEKTLHDIDTLLCKDYKDKVKELYLLYRDKYKNYL